MKKATSAKRAPAKKAAKGKTKRKRYKEIHCRTTKEFNKKAQELMDGKLGNKVCVVLD